MKKNELIDKWRARAKYDLATAKAMLEAKRYIYVAFMCQQALEKIIKTVIINNGGEVVRIHNLVRLAELADVYDQMAEEQQDFLADLSPFAIEARYGDYKENLSEIVNRKEALDYYEKTGKLFKWIEKKALK